MQGEQTSVILIILWGFLKIYCVYFVWSLKFFLFIIIATIKRLNITSQKTLLTLK